MFGRERENVVVKAVLELPHEVFDLLQAFDVEYLIVEPGEKVIANSPRMNQIGLVKDGRITSDPILNVIRNVRRNGEMHQVSISLPRGPLGEGIQERRVRALHIGEAGNVAVLIFDDSESQRLDATRRDFVANISHELKTPIGGLSILGEAILEAIDDPQAIKNFAKRIGAETKRLSDLVKEIIDLSRLQDDDPMVGAKVIDLNEVIQESIDAVKLNADKHKINIDFEQTSPTEVLGDKSQLVRAISNLIDNAVNYSDDNTKVSITIHKRDDLAEIAVKDQGVGIPENELQRIFERFYRVDPARSRETGGTGLGLSIVKHIINNHGGDILVWSAKGEGSTFTVRLPIDKTNRISVSPISGKVS